MSGSGIVPDNITIENGQWVEVTVPDPLAVDHEGAA